MHRDLMRERYSKKWSPLKSDLPRIEAIVKLVGSGKKVLDIGCYDGTISERIARNQNVVYGVDYSPEAIELARKRGIIASCLDIEDEPLPFQKDFFDVIIAAEVIEHIFDTDIFLKKIKSCLKPKGSLILTTPNLATLGRRILLLVGRNPLIEVSWRRETAGHIRYFVRDSLFALLRQHGFKVEIFTSDVVNFTNSGSIFIKWLARLCPTLGKSLIVKAVQTDG